MISDAGERLVKKNRYSSKDRNPILIAAATKGPTFCILGNVSRPKCQIKNACYQKARYSK